jgi:Xaa-Pro aminopeptidase
MDLEAIQKALVAGNYDGWLFYDFHHRDAMAYRILGLDPNSMTSRRWFYFIPAKGEPVKLSHKVEPRKLDSLPGRQEFYLPWTELHEKLRKIVSGCSYVAMQYSPMNNIPYISVVDAGTVELIRSMGPEIVSSADLVQVFEAVLGDSGLASHRAAGETVQRIKDEAYEMMDRSLVDKKPVTEYEVMRFIVDRFEDEGLASHGDVPIVGFNDHPADPHFEPIEKGAYSLKYGDTILLDLWAARRDPPGVFYDVTWCGFAGKEPPARYLEIWNAVCRGRDDALEFVTRRMEAGTRTLGHEVDDVTRKAIVEAGFGDEFLHRTGHSIGTSVHGNGVNIDNLETQDDRELMPGICFSIEPGIYLAGEMAVRTEIDVFITPAGKVEVYGPIQQDLLLVG